MTWTHMNFSPGPQPIYTNRNGDDPTWTPPPPAGFVAAQVLPPARRSSIRWTNHPEPLLWEGDQA